MIEAIYHLPRVVSERIQSAREARIRRQEELQRLQEQGQQIFQRASEFLKEHAGDYDAFGPLGHYYEDEGKYHAVGISSGHGEDWNQWTGEKREYQELVFIDMQMYPGKKTRRYQLKDDGSLVVDYRGNFPHTARTQKAYDQFKKVAGSF